jgi:hypothetical protein
VVHTPDGQIPAHSLGESQMTEPMIEQTAAEVEEFTDELSDEALDRLDREGAKLSSAGTMPSR